MKLSFEQLTTSDKLLLPGLLYSPEKPTKKAAIWLHGMGDNGSFYNPARMNALGSALTDAGYAFLAFNNRGAHNVKSLKIDDETLTDKERRYTGGTFFELISDCVQDIDGVISFLAARGFDDFTLIGHSSGANKICVYDNRKRQNPVGRYIMLGPGDDTGLWYSGLGEAKFRRLLERAEKEIKKGNGKKTVPKYLYPMPFSYQSIYDIINPDGAYNTFPFYEATHRRLGKKPLFQEFKRITKPTLAVIGKQDEYMETAGGASQALGLLRRNGDKNIHTSLLPAADHSFHGKEAELAKTIANWLKT